MNQLIKKILYFPITKIILGITICFSVFLGAQNFILKPIFSSLFQDKNIANPFIHIISFFILLLSYYLLFRFYDKPKFRNRKKRVF